MNKKTISELRPVIRGLGQDLKAVKATFDALRAASSLKSGGSAELLALAEREFTGAITTMRSRIEQIAGAIDIGGDVIAADAAGELADYAESTRG